MTDQSTGAPGRGRRLGAELMITLGVLAMTLAVVTSVARRALFLPDNFADHVAQSLADPRVSSYLADRVTEAVLRESPDLTGFRPIILGAAQATISSAPFRALVRTTARSAHARVFSEGGRTVLVSVPDAGVLLKSALDTTNPALAARIPERARTVVASMGQSRLDRIVMRVWRVGRGAGWLALALFSGGIVLAGAGVVLAANPRAGLVRLGADLLVAAVVLMLLVPAGRMVMAMLPGSEDAGRAAAGLWDAFTGSLRTWGLVLGACGVVLAAGGHSLIARLDPVEVLRRAARLVTDPPGGKRGRLLHAVLLLAVGAVAIVRPWAVVSSAIVLLGACVAYAGLRELFDLVVAAPVPGASSAPGDATTPGLRVGVVVTMVALFLVAIAWIGRPASPAPLAVSDACNGSPALCGRTLDQVVFPATHNAMSAADIPDWFMPQQERSIPAQLEDGIRGLLFDVHYGIPVEGRVKTDLDSDIGSRDKFDQAVGKEGVDAAMRIRDRMAGKEEGRRGPYLCHGFCELGATPLVDALRGIREFLVRNPDEVVVLVIEDYASPADIAGAFADSGLEDLVYKGPSGPPWPTLREMIDTRQRVLVAVESGRPGVPWIRPAFALMQETPYSFKQPRDLSCAANRGGTSGSLFLMNNWVDTTPTPKPSNARIVNAYDALLGRAKRCEGERGKRPTLLAVDFYRTGDLFRVARALNEDPPAATR